MMPRSPARAVVARIPPLNGLEAFEAVARYGSFSKAAEALSITQSAVSHRIGQLEWLLGVALFLRAGHAVSLTQPGSAFLEHVRCGLAALRGGLAALAAPAAPTIRLSLPPALASHWLVRRLTGFQQQHPGISLEINVSSDFLDFRSGQVDVGLRFGRGDWAGLDATELLRARVFPVCSPAYRAAHGGFGTPAELARATLLRQPVLPWQAWFRAAGLDWPEPTSGPAFSEVSLLIDAAIYAQGVALVLSPLVEPQLAAGTLVRLFDLEVECERAYYIVTASDVPPRPAVAALVDWLRNGPG